MKKARVLFVCFGNACRSQIAEGFARHYGHDVMEVSSAGLTPLESVPAQTRMVMLERNIPIDGQYCKGVEVYREGGFDLVINMSGTILPKFLHPNERRWNVADPYRLSDGVFRQVRDDLEQRVLELVKELRERQGGIPAPPPPRRRLWGFGKG
jgi:arsenate reductase